MNRKSERVSENRVSLLVELLFHVCSDVLLDVVLVKCMHCTIDSILLHVLLRTKVPVNVAISLHRPAWSRAGKLAVHPARTTLAEEKQKRISLGIDCIKERRTTTESSVTETGVIDVECGLLGQDVPTCRHS